MSLLIRALEQAAKDRTSTRVEPQSPPAPRQAVESREPTLEPPPPPRPTATFDERAATRSEPQTPSPGPTPAATPSLSFDKPAPPPRRAAPAPAATAHPPAQQRARAAAVMEASGGAATHVLAYLRGNPVMMLAAVAVLFGIGFGLYVYLQIASPGMFVKKAATQAAQPPAAPASAQPPGIPAPTSEVAGSATPGTLVNTPVAANAPSSGAIAAPMPAAAETPASGVTAPAGLQARLPGADPAPAAPGPGLIATSSVLTSSGRVDAPPANERAPEPRLERAANRTSSDVPRPAPAAPREAARTDSPGREQIAVSPTTVQPTVNPQVSQAYALLQSGSLDEARTLYNRVVQAEPLNIDALLGLAYIAAQENRSEDALKAYLRILQLTPRHAIAQAALIGLMGRADPIASETRLKQLLAREPSAFLHFVLGNLYADQSLWNQAQQAYFQAHHLEPDNPDFAYNLAVGLDHLRQSKLALDFYRRAERLATQQGRSNFNLSHARERISSLTSQLE